MEPKAQIVFLLKDLFSRGGGFLLHSPGKGFDVSSGAKPSLTRSREQNELAALICLRLVQNLIDDANHLQIKTVNDPWTVQNYIYHAAFSLNENSWFFLVFKLGHKKLPR